MSERNFNDMHLKKCINCKHYNSERRNEEGLARCSRHPFWVKDDEACESFETMFESSIIKNEQEQIDVPNEETKEKANAFLAIIFSLLAFLGFYLVSSITSGILALIFYFLVKIPLLKTLISWFLEVREDTLDGFILAISLVVAGILIHWLVTHLGKNERTQKVALSIFGMLLTILNIFFLVINLIAGNAIYVNILVVVVGISFFSTGIKK